MYEEDAGATHVFNPDDPVMGVEWSVNVSDDDTRTMRAPDIAFEYLRGGLDPNDTFVWRDGMGDWIPLGQCQELVDIIRQYEGGQPPTPSQAQPDPYGGAPQTSDPAAAPYSANPYGSAPPPVSAPYGSAPPPVSAPYGGAPPAGAYDPHADADDDDDLGSTVMMDPSAQAMIDQAQQAQGVAAYPSSQPESDEVSQTMASPFDLGEEDPFADARPPEAGGHDDGPRRVGERNEASALFSLDQIRAEAQAEASSKGGARGEDDPFADMMSLGGGGGIAGAFAPPPINAPAPPPPPPKPKPAPAPVQASAPPPGSMGPGSMAPPGSMAAASMPPPSMAASMAVPEKKSRTGVIVGALVAVLVVGGGVAAFALTGGSAPETTAETAPVDEPDDAKEAEEAEEGEEEEVAEEDEGTDDDKEDEEKTAKGDEEEKDDEENEDDKAGSTTTTTKTTSSTASKDDDKDDDTAKKGDDKTAKKDDKKEEEKVAKSEFNRDAARSALASAAGAASGCKKAGGPTGRGKVIVTFAPSGRATQATVGPPFAGTSVGSCAAGAFRGVSVPPFTGGAITVSKSFFIK